MTRTHQTERRQHQRFPLATSVQFNHTPSQRDFPGRCADISTGGMMMFVPATTPVQVGHVIRLDLNSLPRPDLPKLNDHPVDATVVRVDRQALLQSGNVAVAVRFAGT